MTGLFTLLLTLILGVPTASAQQTAVCSNTPGTGEWIECTQDATSTNDIDIDVDGVDINTTGEGEDGIKARHGGNGDITIDVTGTDTIMTSGTGSRGILGHHTGNGAIGINLEGRTSITTTGSYGHGIQVLHQGAGDVEINLTSDSSITTVGDHSQGIFAKQEGSQNTSNITIIARGGSVTTQGKQSEGIIASHEGTGNIVFDLKALDIITESTEVDSNSPHLPPAHGLYGVHYGSGDIDINAIGGSVVTKSLGADGVRALHRNSGDILINLTDVDITTESAQVDGDGRTITHGVFGWHSGTGDIDIDVRGGSVTTKGVFSYGLYGIHQGDGDVDIATHDGLTITTTGANSHGIVAYNYGELDTRSMAVSVGDTINVSGEGAQGVRVGIVNADGASERVAALDEEGYRQQTVTVNGVVTSNAEGVFLAGGGRVIIGPGGSIASDSGIAILATGTVPAGTDPVTDPIPPKLRVDLNLGGRRVAQAIGDDWIINDGGETTIAVNGTVLHDGVTGVTGRTASNGAWNVQMREEGVTVTDRTNPAHWIISEPATGVVADRDFSAADFNERRKPPPPPPPMCPEGQVGTPPNCNEPEPERPMFMEEYAPRAALYELVPDFLLRLTSPGPTRTCQAAPDTPVWVRFAGGQGSYQGERSTTGATYTFDRFETEGGLSATLNERVKGWASVRHVQGRADGASPTGGGRIDARGLGSTVGMTWRGETGVYAVGCFSYMGYNLDFASTNQGLLRGGVNGQAYTLDFEVGRRLEWSETMHLTPRVWVMGSRVSIDPFTDAVGAWVTAADTDRVLVGVGVQADTTRPWADGAFFLRGSVDVERIVSGAETTTTVSGARLSAEATGQSLLVGLNGVYRHDRITAGAELVARQELGSNDSEYVGFLKLGISF